MRLVDDMVDVMVDDMVDEHRDETNMVDNEMVVETMR